MVSRGRKLKKPERLNLIPILDAIFIFIFFLLMSAQFIEIHEIASDAPVTSTLTHEDKKKPLSLVLVVTDKYIKVKTGLKSKTLKTIRLENGQYKLKELRETLISLKQNHKGESTIILKPDRKVKYLKIVTIMDTVKDYKTANGITRDLFKKIVFETM
jgi:biopolymer transport protein ExbD